MTDIKRIVDLIKNSGCYWSYWDLDKILFEENGVLYFISEAYIDSLAIFELGLTRLIYLALVYYNIDKPFEILHKNSPRISDASIFKHNGRSYRYKKGYSYLTDTRSFDVNDEYSTKVCELQMEELLNMIINEWIPDKAELLAKVLVKYHDYVNPKYITIIIEDMPDMQTDVKSILLRFIHDNDNEERNIEL